MKIDFIVNDLGIKPKGNYGCNLNTLNLVKSLENEHHYVKVFFSRSKINNKINILKSEIKDSSVILDSGSYDGFISYNLMKLEPYIKYGAEEHIIIAKKVKK